MDSSIIVQALAAVILITLLICTGLNIDSSIILQVLIAVILITLLICTGLNIRLLNKANLLFTYNCQAQKDHSDIAARIFKAQSVEQAEACNAEIDKFYNTWKGLIEYKNLQTLTCSLDGLINLQITVLLSNPKTKTL